jgi:hypothetical protein
MTPRPEGSVETRGTEKQRKGEWSAVRRSDEAWRRKRLGEGTGMGPVWRRRWRNGRSLRLERTVAVVTMLGSTEASQRRRGGGGDEGFGFSSPVYFFGVLPCWVVFFFSVFNGSSKRSSVECERVE